LDLRCILKFPPIGKAYFDRGNVSSVNRKVSTSFFLSGWIKINYRSALYRERTLEKYEKGISRNAHRIVQYQMLIFSACAEVQRAGFTIVGDLTNSIYIVDLKHDAALNFKADFSGQYFDIRQVIRNIQAANFIVGKSSNHDFEYAEPNNKIEFIKRYS
jgi:hypothetical protein